MIREFGYRVPWLVRGYRPGHHPSVQHGGGMAFRAHVPLAANPDPRRLDLRASMRDPFERWLVREFRQRSSIAVIAAVDVSASLGFAGERYKLGVAADFVASLGYSAHRSGDRFGVMAFDRALRPDWLVPPRQQKVLGVETAARLRALRELHGGHAGLLRIREFLPREPSLLFVLSDFHFPLDDLARFLDGLGRHACVPVVLWDRAEFERLPEHGLAALRDLESGGERLLWLRPGLAQRIREEFARRRGDIVRVCREHGHAPLFLTDGFDPDRVTEHFFH